jgi:hypothetical protein
MDRSSDIDVKIGLPHKTVLPIHLEIDRKNDTVG